MDERFSPPLVVHVIYALGTGGLENGLVNIINRASPARYRHAIICLTRAEGFEKRITAPNIELISLHKRPGHDLKIYWNLWVHLKRLKPAIVHTRNLAALEMQLVTCLLPGVKRVHGEHGRDVHDLEGQNKKYNYLRRAIRPFIHHYIAVSKDLAGWLQQTIGVIPQRIKQIYNGVDQEKFSPQSTIPSTFNELVPNSWAGEDTLVIGTVGRLAEVKDQLSILEAFALLIEKSPEYQRRLRLLVVGDGPMRERLNDRIESLNLSSQVWMAGDREDIPECLRLMDVFVLPSLGEGISNTILEAMASGLPIIATRVGGNPELIDEGVNGLLVPVGEPGLLADALKKLIESPQLRAQNGLESLRIVSQDFDWNRTVAEYLSVYDQLLGRASGITTGASHSTTGSL